LIIGCPSTRKELVPKLSFTPYSATRMYQIGCCPSLTRGKHVSEILLEAAGIRGEAHFDIRSAAFIDHRLPGGGSIHRDHVERERCEAAQRWIKHDRCRHEIPSFGVAAAEVLQLALVNLESKIGGWATLASGLDIFCIKRHLIGRIQRHQIERQS
jgi:hypothetical protein